MPLFSYTLLTPDGEEKPGTLQSIDISSAAEMLRSRGRAIISLQEVADVQADKQVPVSMGILNYFSFVRSQDLVIFFRELSTLIKAGVTLTHSLVLLEKESSKRKLRFIVGKTRRNIEQGTSFAEALRMFPKTFPPLITNMIEAGEMGGILDTVLERIADHLESSSEFRTQVITSFIYPAIVVIMTVIAVAFLVGFVIPKFAPFLEARGGKLPWNTQFLIDTSHWLHANWIYITGSAAVIVIGTFLVHRTYTGGLVIDALKIKIPVIGQVFVHSTVVQFSSSLSSLLTSGISMLQSLKTVRGVISNKVAAKIVSNAVEKVTQGEDLSTSLEKGKGIFPPMVAGMVKVGEETGALDHTLELMANIHQKLLQNRLKRIQLLIEPVTILILGSIVGFVAWGLIAGMLSLYSAR